MRIENTALNGHAIGKAGAGTANADFREYIAGDECATVNNEWYSGRVSSGVSCFPKIKYFTSVMNVSRLHTIPIADIDAEVMAKGYKGDANLAKLISSSGSGTYDPAAATSYFYNLIYGDIVFGRFTRVSIYKTGASNERSRFILGLGPVNAIPDEKLIS